MGATPSHEDDAEEVAEPEDSDEGEEEDDVIKIQNGRYRVRVSRSNGHFTAAPPFPFSKNSNWKRSQPLTLVYNALTTKNTNINDRMWSILVMHIDLS